MTGLDDLPPDQRAALSLLLSRRKSYSEVAALLGISEQAIQERARAALDGLANGAGTDAEQLSPQRRADIGDYLLGQQPGVAERLRTRTYLDTSPPARAWASALASRLAPLTEGPLPEIPTGAPAPPAPSAEHAEAPAPAPAAPPVQDAGEPPTPPPPPAAHAVTAPAGRPLPSSRIGGALLLTAIVTGIIVAVVLISGEGGGARGARHNTTPPAGTPSATSTSATSSPSASTTTPSTTTSGPTEQARIGLTPTDPTSKAIGVAVILAEGSEHAFYLAAEHMPPTRGFFYGVWLYNSPTSFEALGKSPPVSANGRMQGGALLPTDAAAFSRLIVTRETSTRPTHPGPIVLSGTVKLGH